MQKDSDSMKSKKTEEACKMSDLWKSLKNSFKTHQF